MNSTLHHPCVAIFAHNEAARISDCLKSLEFAYHTPRAVRVRVLVNGSTDRTEQIVRSWAALHSNVEPIEIPFGDKANAWNAYVYGGINFDCNHYFLDGDCALPPGTIDVLEAEFLRHNPLCVAPLPKNVSDGLREFLTRWSLPCGTMYGVSGDFLRRMVVDNIRIPIGFIGDDNLLASLLHSNLDDRLGNYDRSRVRIVDSVGPVVYRPPHFSLEMLQLQRTRLRRYALRRVQMELLNYHVRCYGLRSLPSEANELSRYWRRLGLGWYFRFRGLETPYVLRALWCISREAKTLSRRQDDQRREISTAK